MQLSCFLSKSKYIHTKGGNSHKKPKCHMSLKKKKNLIQKTSTKTEKSVYTFPLSECLSYIKLLKLSYLSHQYQVHNNAYYWLQILSTVDTMGPIYHMDYLESIPQLFKNEPQSSHFNKRQYSLHCTVMYNASIHHHKYIYHLSVQPLTEPLQ